MVKIIFGTAFSGEPNVAEKRFSLPCENLGSHRHVFED
jgi:hypothetical protein